MEKYLDTNLTPEERAKDLLAKMSLEEKMAQTQSMFPARDEAGDWSEATREACRYGLGSVSTLEVRQMKSLEEAADFQRSLQKLIMEQSPHHIPAMFHMEGLCSMISF